MNAVGYLVRNVVGPEDDVGGEDEQPAEETGEAHSERVTASVTEEPQQDDKQRPELFAKALRGAKRELDPKGLMNPGVLIDP